MTLHADFKKKLDALREKRRIPSLLLVSSLKESTAYEALLSCAKILAGQDRLSEGLGNLILLGLDEEKQVKPNIKIDEVRELLQSLHLQSWEPGKNRFVLIPAAQRLTVQSSNALLKSLEEPPPGLCFILGCPSKRTVLSTIESRALTLKWILEEKPTQNFEENIFYKAFFNKREGLFKGLKKKDVEKSWHDFHYGLRDRFCAKVYEGELDSQEWSRLFDYMEDLEKEIGSYRDPKWLEAAIERFHFNG